MSPSRFGEPYTRRFRRDPVSVVALTPIPDRPALELAAGPGDRGPTVIVSDLHLGLGALDEREGMPMAGLARAMALDLLAIGHDRSAQRFVFAGDVKHPIVGVPPALRPVVFDFFSTVLSAGFGAEVVLGNHDVGLVRALPKEVVVHPAAGIVRHGVGIFHGHRWPSNAVLRSPRVVVGHLHPGYRFAPTPETPAMKERCWVRARRPYAPPPDRRKRRPPLRALEVIVLPAFNPIAGAEALNRDRPSRGRSFLVRRFLSPGECRAYLLDGTDVGPVLTNPNGHRPRSRSAAASDR